MKKIIVIAAILILFASCQSPMLTTAPKHETNQTVELSEDKSDITGQTSTGEASN